MLVGSICLAVVAAGCGSDSSTTTESTAENPLAPPAVRVQYGKIDTLTAKPDGTYVMRFDPAFMLAGVTANTAAAEDGAVSPGEPVPNDYYTVDESKRLYTYLVSPDAKVTVLGRSSPDEWGPTVIGVEDLVAIVDGTSEIDLFEPIDTGVWITIDIDTVTAIYQQYKP